MSRTSALLLVAVCMVGAAPPLRAQADSASARAEIEAAYERIAQGLRTRDTSMILTEFAPDWVIVSITGTATPGRDIGPELRRSLDSVEVWLDIGHQISAFQYFGDSVLVRRHSWQESRDRMNTAPGQGRLVRFASWFEDAWHRNGSRWLLVRRQRLRPTEYRIDGQLVELTN